MKDLSGRVALVSGAGRGQGRSHALHLARRGAAIAALDICEPVEASPFPVSTRQNLDETASLIEAEGSQVVTRAVDVRDFDSLADFVAMSSADLGTIDIVVANAGVLGHPGPSWQLDSPSFRGVLDVNVLGAWNTLKAVVGPLVEAGRPGAGVVTGSGASVKALLNMVSYVASKHAIVGVVRAMAMELAPHGIRINAVLPGNVNTQMFHNDAVHSMFLPDLPQFDESEFLARASAGVPMGIPFVEPSDISEAVCWLVSDAARYVTGTLLPVDGGSGIPK